MKETDEHAVVLGQLDPHDKAIREDEGRSIEARWDFGNVLLKQRDDKKQLRRGLVARVVKEYGVSRSEIHRRMQLAEKFKSKSEVSHAWDKYGSWQRITRDVLPKTPRKEKAERLTEKVEPSPEDQTRVTVRRLALWAGGSDDRCDKLVAILREDLRPLGINVTKAGS